MLNVGRVLTNVFQRTEREAPRATLEAIAPALKDTNPTDPVGIARKAFFDRTASPEQHAAAGAAKLAAEMRAAGAEPEPRFTGAWNMPQRRGGVH